MEWDLILTYTPVVDNVYHQFLGMIYPSMPYYEPSKEAFYRDLIARTNALVDSFVGEILRNIDTRTTTLIITSDHCQCPVKYFVNINAILYNAGLLSISGGGLVLNKTKAWYVGHGHVFVNLRGREVEGSVDPSEYSLVVDQIMRALQAVRDPDNGEPVFDMVITRDQARALGLWGERVGDIVIATRCGYTASGGIPAIRNGTAVVFSPAIPITTATEDHETVLPGYRELHATFIAYGGGVLKGYLGQISALSIAPTIAEILGIERPRNSVSPPLPIIPRLVGVETKTVTARETIYMSVTRISTAISVWTITQHSTAYNTVTETQRVATMDSGYIIAISTVALMIGLAIGYVVRSFIRR